MCYTYNCLLLPPLIGHHVASKKLVCAACAVWLRPIGRRLEISPRLPRAHQCELSWELSGHISATLHKYATAY